MSKNSLLLINHKTAKSPHPIRNISNIKRLMKNVMKRDNLKLNKLLKDWERSSRRIVTHPKAQILTARSHKVASITKEWLRPQNKGMTSRLKRYKPFDFNVVLEKERKRQLDDFKTIKISNNNVFSGTKSKTALMIKKLFQKSKNRLVVPILQEIENKLFKNLTTPNNNSDRDHRKLKIWLREKKATTERKECTYKRSDINNLRIVDIISQPKRVSNSPSPREKRIKRQQSLLKLKYNRFLKTEYCSQQKFALENKELLFMKPQTNLRSPKKQSVLIPQKNSHKKWKHKKPTITSCDDISNQCSVTRAEKHLKLFSLMLSKSRIRQKGRLLLPNKAPNSARGRDNNFSGLQSSRTTMEDRNYRLADTPRTMKKSSDGKYRKTYSILFKNFQGKGASNKETNQEKGNYCKSKCSLIEKMENSNFKTTDISQNNNKSHLRISISNLIGKHKQKTTLLKIAKQRLTASTKKRRGLTLKSINRKIPSIQDFISPKTEMKLKRSKLERGFASEKRRCDFKPSFSMAKF